MEVNRRAIYRAQFLLGSASGWLLALLLLSSPIWLAPARAAVCFQAPSGTIGWWPGDGNPNDIANGNNALLQGGATANSAGFVGSAFGFDGTNGFVQVPDNPVLHPTNLTIEAWVRFNLLDSPAVGGSPAGDQYIVFKQNSQNANFEGFDLSKTRLSGGGDQIRFEVSSPSGQSVEIDSVTRISVGVWYHVAGVRGSNFLQLYINGQLEAQASVSFPQDYGTLPLFFGTSGQSFWDHKLSGTLDEVTLYNRALGSDEIAGIYGAGAQGKCKAPIIISQPQSVAVVVGGSANFSVSATGKAPLSYQWQFNGVNLAGVTSTNLTLTNVQVTDGGNYVVVVSNSLGTVSSATAVLTVLTAPTITTQPQNRTNVIGTSASFSVTASGTQPLSYQWMFNGNNLFGATGSSLTLNNVQPTDAGGYSVLITNSQGSITSAVATLTVLVPPAITLQPQSLTNVLGSPASFNAAASGTAPLSYQWMLNGASIPGATTTSFALASVQATDAGNYTFVASNSAGSATSAVAVLTVLVPPSFVVQPQSRTNIAGTLATFSGSVSGTAPLSYRWQFNGANIAGATTPSLFLSNVQPSDAGSYTLSVTNAAGAITSSVATLTVLVPPAITAQPQSRTNLLGTTATFSVLATGTAPLNYQWRFNNSDLPGANGTSLVLNSVQSSDAGNYSVVITNSGGSITSAVAVLTVWVVPSIVVQPQSRTNVLGTTATFSVSAVGTAPLVYQWLFNGTIISGATSSSLNLPNVQPGNTGSYTVLITNQAGSVTSAPAVLTVIVPPSFVTQPLSRTNLVGTVATFSGSATGTAPLAYQWQLNGVALSGATSSDLTLGSVQPGDAGSYTLVVTNSAGSITSAVAVLTVLVPPGITAQPSSRTNLAGTSASFSVSAFGTGPLSYQWRFHDIDILGATNSTLLLNNVQPFNAGGYYVVVTNSYGTVTSTVATLTILVPPSISLQPQNRTNYAGTIATFIASANGTTPLTFQWRFNGVALTDNARISGSTSNILTIVAVQPSDVGAYSLVVTNIAGTATSASASLSYLPICTPSVSGTVGWWPADGNVSDIAGGNNAVLQGGATANAVGFVGNGFGFDGVNSYVQVPDNPVFHPTNLTIEAWVRFNSLDSTGSGGSPAGDQYIVFKQNSQNANFEGFDLSKTRLGGNGDQIRFLVSAASGLSVEIDSVTRISAGVWYHVAAVRGTNFVQLYINGQLETQASVSFPQDYGTLPLFFGSSGQSFWDHKLSGTLDEVTLYNRALGSDEIAGIYAAGAQGKCKSPVIISQPQSAAVAVGGNATLSVAATGKAPLSYQWQFNGANLPGATSTNLTLTNVQVSNGGNYVVVVSNSLGAVSSIAAVLTPITPPGISAQPQDRTNVVGTTANFSVASSGTPPFSYQWMLNGNNLFGANSSNLTLANVQPTDAGSYSVTVSNAAGVATSSSATLTVWIPPSITLQPQSRTNVVGTFASFSTAASGTTPYSYQWQLNGQDIPGATSPTLTLNSVQASDAGNYTVVVTNPAGSVVSATAILTVWVPPGIAVQPQSRTNLITTIATFSVIPSGTTPFGYQWFFNGNIIAGATNAVLVLPNLQLPNAGNYSVFVTNVAGSVLSSPATLTVWVPPIITAQPQSRTNIVGTTGTFSASADGTAPLNYQWQFNGVDLLGATSTTLTLQNIQASDAGAYAIVATNQAGSIVSVGAILTVWVPPSITIPPQSQTNAAGTSATFSVTASGTTPFSYQWQFNGTNIAAATNANFTINNVQPLNAGSYSVVVSNSAGVASSGPAALTVIVPPSIQTQPLSQEIVAGANVLFTLTASGTAPLTYQWEKNGSDISGATSTALFVPNVQNPTAGGYTAIVSNWAAAVTSSVAVLTVITPPAFFSLPSSVTNIVGTTVSFSAVVTGTTPMTFQWQFNGSNLADNAQVSGSTSSNLVLTGVQPNQSGVYTLNVTNRAGSAVSAPATLSVIVPAAILSQPQGQTVIAGTNVVFTVGASGTPPLVYQWQLNNNNVPGATSSSLQLPNVQSASAGTYTAIVGNWAGSVTSAPALLTVLVPPSITVPPVSLTTLTGSTASFSAVGAGTQPLSYQWQFNGAPLVDGDRLSGSLTTNLTIVNVGASDVGSYALVVSNTVGSVTSSVATLTLAVAPAIVAQPSSLDVKAGSNILFTVSATGSGPLAYRWQKNGNPLSDNGKTIGSGTATLSLLSVQTNDIGSYQVVVTNIAGSVTSAVATLNVAPPTVFPGIVTQPTGQTLLTGNNAYFTVTTIGTEPLVYQWQKDGVNLSPTSNVIGTTSPSLQIQSVQASNSGNYRVFVTNGLGAVTSSVAPLTVLAPQTVGADALVLVNSASARYLDFQRMIQPYLDNFGVPYTVVDISTNHVGTNLLLTALIIVGHAQLDTNHFYLDTSAQLSISTAVSNGTGLVNFDSDLWVGTGSPRYQFVQDIFGFGFKPATNTGIVAFPPTEAGSQMHYVTALHATNEILTLSNRMNITGVSLPAGGTAIAVASNQPVVSVTKYGLGRALQWTSYDWISTSVQGPLNGLDDLVWRGLVWAARKPFVLRGLPNFVAMRIDDVEGPFWWVHVANEVGFKPYMAMFIGNVSPTNIPDLRQLTTSGNASAGIHSFTDSTLFYFDHLNHTNYPDSVISNNFYAGAQWHATNGIPISKCMIPHYSEIGPNAFAGLHNLGVEFIAIEVVPGTVEYFTPPAPWLVAGPYRYYETPKAGLITLPLSYADFLTIPGHPEMNGMFFDRYTEIRNTTTPGQFECGEWCPTINDLAGSIDRGTRQIKRALDSMVLASLFSHEWYIHPTACCGSTVFTTNAWRAMLQSITNNLSAYHPIYVTTDYADQYVRATRTSRIISSQFDTVSGRVLVSLSGKTDLDTSVQVFLGNDSGITNILANVPAFQNFTLISAATLPTAPQILVAPSGSTNVAGSTATFSVSVGGTSPLSYQWFGNGVPLVDDGNVLGSSTPTLVFSVVDQSKAGPYSVLVTNSAGSVISPVATLTVVVPPVVNLITLLPDKNIGLSLTAGSNLTYQIGASTNLIDWVALTNISSPNGLLQFYDLNATNYSGRFYRAMWVP
jgi:hypothetical protein